jgi:hypothetical protein
MEGALYDNAREMMTALKSTSMLSPSPVPETVLQNEDESDDQALASHLVCPMLIREDRDKRPNDEPKTLTDTAPVAGELERFNELNVGTK